jgi:hypothetical protein
MLKLIVNYNYQGYKWFTINNISRFNEIYFKPQNEENNDLTDEQRFYQDISNPEHPIIRHLKSWSPYKIFFSEDNGELILAIRGLKEELRVDAVGRPVEAAIIFVGDIDDYSLFYKILLSYIHDPDCFDQWLTSSFVGELGKLICNVERINTEINKIGKTNFSFSDSENAKKIEKLKTYRQCDIYFLESDAPTDRIIDELQINNDILKKAVFFTQKQCEDVKESITVIEQLNDHIEGIVTDNTNKESKQIKYIIIGFIAGLVLGFLIKTIL